MQPVRSLASGPGCHLCTCRFWKSTVRLSHERKFEYRASPAAVLNKLLEKMIFDCPHYTSTLMKNFLNQISPRDIVGFMEMFVE
jgi:hypothetical protein